MSILDRNDTPNLIPPAKMAANRLINMTKQTYQQMVQSFNHGSQVFWANSMGATPAEIAAELGNDAKEVFELHNKLGELISTIKPESISEGINLIGNFTMNEDGTVTIAQQDIVTTPNPE